MTNVTADREAVRPTKLLKISFFESCSTRWIDVIQVYLKFILNNLRQKANDGTQTNNNEEQDTLTFLVHYFDGLKLLRGKTKLGEEIPNTRQ